MDGTKILVVDDEERMRKLVKDFLTKREAVRVKNRRDEVGSEFHTESVSGV